MKPNCLTLQGRREKTGQEVHITRGRLKCGTFHGDNNTSRLRHVPAVSYLCCPHACALPYSVPHRESFLAPSNSCWELDLDDKGLRQEDGMGGTRVSPTLTSTGYFSLPPTSSASSRKPLPLATLCIEGNGIQLSDPCVLGYPL